MGFYIRRSANESLAQQLVAGLSLAGGFSKRAIGDRCAIWVRQFRRDCARPFLLQGTRACQLRGAAVLFRCCDRKFQRHWCRGQCRRPLLWIPTISSNALGTVQTAPGNLRRDTFTGPVWWNFDFSSIKDPQITPGVALQFRTEFFNLFNHSTFGTPTSVLGDPSFGLSTGTATTERQIQFGLRLTF
jgi:hypothetical protein